MPNNTKPIKCGRCKYITEVPEDLLPEFNPRDCILIQSGGRADAVCAKYLEPNPPNRPFANTQYF